MSTIEFGTDGIRGHADEWPIVPEVAERLGGVLCRLAADPEGRGGASTRGAVVLVCTDTRPSGLELSKAVAKGITAAGGVARLGGICPTPGLAFGLAEGLGTAGVMITASHNPVGDNGFKVFGVGGHKLSESLSATVEQWLAEDPPRGEGGRQERTPAIREAHERALLGAVDWEALRGRTIALDLAHGAASIHANYLRGLSSRFEIEWAITGDGSGTINDGVGSEHIGHLQQFVRERGAWAGIAVDGDGDRCRIVDGQGRALPGDAVAAWLARKMGVAGMAVTVMSNGALEGVLPDVHVVRTKVGDKHLRAAMEQQGLALGSEESGHVLFGDLVAGDGLIAGLRALSYGDPVQAHDAFSPLPRRKDKVAVSDRPPLDEVDALVQAREQLTPDLGPGGRIFLRYSGTEPVLRILVEGIDDQVVDEVTRKVKAVAEEAL